MKKRIISLILVVATVFLTLTGCAYNYAKDDMTKYATFDAGKFFEALQALSIEDGTFGTDENKRQEKVQDAIAQAILKITDATDKKYAGKVEKFDSLYFCYYATDADGNIFFANKMDESKPTNIQVGLTTLADLNKAVSEGVLSIEDIKSHIYSTSASSVVSNGDIITLSYVKTWTEKKADGTDDNKAEDVINSYTEVNTKHEKLKPLHDALIGAKVGVQLETPVVITEGDKTYTYNNIKVESIVKDNSPVKVADGDSVYITYTISFVAPKDENGEYKLPEGFDPANITDGNYKATVSYELVTVAKDVPAEGEDKVADDKKTFLGQLIDKTAGSTTSSITVKNGGTYDSALEGLEVKFTNVKINWIVNSTTSSFDVKYTPYTEAINDKKDNIKTETNIYGEKIELNKKELTYHIYPVYYLDVEEVSAELLLREFSSIVASTEVAEHDHTEEDHEHEEVYVFDVLNDEEYKNGEKTLKTLVTELLELVKTYTTKEKARTDALKSLTTAQNNRANDKGTSESETENLKTKEKNAHDAYVSAKHAVGFAEADVDKKIEEILGCKKGETAVADELVKNYNDYQYDTLEDGYKAELKTKLATEIIKHLNDNTTYLNNLPKRAVKDAYKAIMNTHKHNFYEGKYSTGTSTSTSTETNYSHYKGDFDAYLLDKVTSGKGDMKLVESELQKQAEETVKDIILIYVFAAAVNEKWDADITLTKDEKKEIKKNLENTALLYQQYGLSFSYNVDDSYHAEQFDKAMNYLLEVKENEDENNKVVEYEHIKYSIKAEDK